MSKMQDEKLVADVAITLDALKEALRAATEAGLKTYIHADDGSFEDCDLTVEITREYRF